MHGFEDTFSYKLIYVFAINDDKHKGLLKIGDTSIHTNLPPNELFPSCKELNEEARKRINSYTQTASIDYELLYTELAIKNVKEENNKITLQAFRDYDVHNVLMRSNIKKHNFKIQNQGNEWFETDLETVKKAINAVKENKNCLDPTDISKNNSPIIFRPEQEKAIEETIRQFRKGDRMLWNAKMRFGKTLTALELAKRMQFHKTLILTHKPVVNDSWFNDFNKIFKETNFKYGSKTEGEKIQNLVDTAIHSSILLHCKIYVVHKQLVEKLTKMIWYLQ